MVQRFDKFTERARRVLSIAQETSILFNHNCIGTEHLLIALLAEPDSAAVAVMRAMSVDPDRVRQEMEASLMRRGRPVRQEIGLTERARKMIEMAVDEARMLNHHYIGTEHLLLGLIREGTEPASNTLKRHGIGLDRARMATSSILSARVQAAQEASSAPASGTAQRIRTGARSAVPEMPAGPLAVPLSARVRAVLVDANTERRRRAAPDIRPEHIALALLADAQTRTLLAEAGADLERLRGELTARLAADDPGSQA